MSTRAIVTVKSADGTETRRLYCHGDGYPSEVGKLVYNFAKFSPRIDGNSSGSTMQKVAFGDWSSKDPVKREGKYHKLPPLGQAYSTMYNVTVDPDKFVPALISFMINKGYGGVYITDRDPVKEAAEKGHGDEYGTDIEWHYVVTLGKEYGAAPKVDVFESIAYGPKKLLYRDSNGKDVMYGSLQKFVSRGSVPQAIALEERKYRAQQEKEEAEKKLNEEKSLLTPLTPIKRGRRKSALTSVKPRYANIKNQVGGMR